MADVIRESQYSFTGATDVLNGISGSQLGASLKFYIVTIANVGATAQNISAEDDADGEVYEIVLNQFDGVIAYDSVGATGLIYVITDAHGAPEASVLEARIQALGSAVGPNTIDVSGSTVVEGTRFTIA